MLNTQAKLLIVDDEPLIRTSLAHIFTEMGYQVRSAEDGYSALAELQKEIPDFLLSDLYMPGMSGFELLSEVQHSFPSIRTVAMSGAFSGDEVPSGVAAHAFYQKGCDVAILLEILQSLTRSTKIRHNDPAALAPISIQAGERDTLGES